jgi:hypothetical protein
MRTIISILILALGNTALAHFPLSQATINAMNMINSANVQGCIRQLNSRHPGDFYLQSATLHNAGINSEYHLFGAFIEGGDMVHGSAHVDVKVGLNPPMGPGFRCRIISENEEN